MIRVIAFPVVFVLVATVLVWGAAPVHGGANPEHKVAIHVVAHGLSCKSLPTFTECSQIVMTYPDSGDIDMVPVFFGLSEYTVVEFGLTWPEEWGSCWYISCKPTLNIGSIANSGDGIAGAWTTCQTGWSVVPGYGWLNATGAGRVSIVPNAATGDYGVVDCAESPGPYYDRPETTFVAGIGGTAGDDPCGEGGRGDGKGDSGELPALRIARIIEVTDGTTQFMQPVWSPDGTRLVFTTPGFDALYVKNSDGSGEVRQVSPDAFIGYKPTWTADSRGIVVRRRTGAARQDVSYIDVETGELIVVDESATHPDQPSRDARGNISVVMNGRTKVLDTTTRTLRSRDEFYSKGISAPPDVSIETDYRNQRIWVVNGDNGTRTAFPAKVLAAQLSPLKDRIVFLGVDGNLYVSDLDGSRLANLGRDAEWDWSPGETRLAFVRCVDWDEFTMTAAELFLANHDGGGLVQLTFTGDVVENFPAWSPDGMKLAYSGDNTGKIYVAFLKEVR